VDKTFTPIIWCCIIVAITDSRWPGRKVIKSLVWL